MNAKSTEKYAYDTFSTPVGDFSLAVNEAGAVVATAFGDLSALKKRNGTRTLEREPSKTSQAREQIADYFDGKRRKFELSLGLRGTPFQYLVWKGMGQIQFGQTLSYGELARKIGNAPAARAVGRASGANPICLIVPCHRVIGADGSLTGFAFGEKIKRRLLEHESQS